MLRTVGVGGLDGPFEQIFRRVFASRLAPKELVREMGVKHVRGLLLHGKGRLGGEKGEEGGQKKDLHLVVEGARPTDGLGLGPGEGSSRVGRLDFLRLCLGCV